MLNKDRKPPVERRLTPRQFVERRLSPRIKMTVRRHVAYWVAMSPARRVVFSLGLAAAIGGTTFGACRASDLTGPDFKSKQQYANGSVSRSLGGDLIDDEDSDSWPMVPSSKKELTDDEANADPEFVQTTEVTTPVTEAVYNTCRNELVVLNGHQKTRTRLKVDPLNSIEFRLQQWKDTRGVYGEYKYQEDYWDNDSQSWKQRERVVRYRNRSSLLDRFEAGPVGLPFRSDFHSVMFLQRDEHWHDGHRDGDHHHEWKPGDDLFVKVRSTQKIDKNGNIRTQDEFRTECK